ncbi:MAG: hypothetical protein WDO13_17680 [Verrucomicrobiota bacterium]
MPRNPVFVKSSRLFSATLFLLVCASGALRAGTPPVAISGQDVDGRPVAVNGKGHYTVVMYTNPDLEDESRKMTLALDAYRARPDFSFIRVVDLRGEIPPNMRSMVRGQIRKEQAKESARLKKAGVVASNGSAPIIPDFSGSTLDALGWDSVYDQVHLVVYDPHGKEVKRIESVTDAKQMTQVVASVL